MTSLRFALLAAACLPLSAVALSAPALAQDSETPDAGADTSDSEVRGGDHFHSPIVVTAAGGHRLDVLAGTSVVGGMELQRNLDGQLGEMLAHLPGVSATSFAPGASRPVLRGFTGERVRVLTDGVGTIDASSVSADHAVSIDPLIADRIEVLRGPAVLLYGSQAIGGAINVITKRIPPRVPDEPIHVDAMVRGDTATGLGEVGVSLDAPITSNLAFHVDGSHRESGDVSVPGFVLSDPLRADLLADAAEHEEHGEGEEADELRGLANQRGVIANSGSRTTSLGAGLAFFSGNSNLGLSFGYLDSSYGVPTMPGAGHAHEEEEHDDHDHEEEGHDHEGPVTIGLRQYRVDLRGALDLGGGLFETLATRWGYSDYTHTEFEGDEVGTQFFVKGVEGRVELVQAARGNWRGSVGGQFSWQDFSAVGAEAFVPANTTNNFAVFALQEIAFDPFEVEFGGRYEHTDIETADLTRNFDTVAGSVGLSYGITDRLRFGINGSRAERAPSAQELFADGPHVATQQYELGNVDLKTEGAWGVETWLRGNVGRAEVTLAFYRNWFDGFIFLSETGGEQDGLPEYSFLQQDADQLGFEGMIAAPLVRADGFTLKGELQADYVRATLADGSPVPRIPPLSLGGALEAGIGQFDARAEVKWYDKQTRVADLETPTDGFTHVNLSLGWHPLSGQENVTVLLQADNLLNAEGRRHASFTKDFVPLAGRNVKLSVRMSI